MVIFEPDPLKLRERADETVTDWSQDDALRDALIAEIAAEFPKPPRPGDLTKEAIMQSTGWSAPTAAYRLGKLVDEGKLQTEMCMIGGKRIRVWRRVQ